MFYELDRVFFFGGGGEIVQPHYLSFQFEPRGIKKHSKGATHNENSFYML